MADDPLEQWMCSICGYVHDDEEPPDMCPICAAPSNKFVEYIPGEEEDRSYQRPGKPDDDDEFYGEFDEP
ncbi:hypothetical protein GF420_10005 [candidate division GN15 bacterium]|nr:hypothetical protein [candidate division GN15 bacterium]